MSWLLRGYFAVKEKAVDQNRGAAVGGKMERCKSIVNAVRVNFLVILLLPGLVFAQASSSSSTTSGSASAGLLVALAIVYSSRHRAVGGWLLYYYISLYGSLLMTVIMFAITFRNLAPSAWTDSFLYVMELISYAPPLILKFLEAIFGTILLRHRNQASLARLKFTLASSVAAAAVALGIDARYFPESGSLPFDSMGLFFATVWTWYFYASSRVKAVFVDHSWVVPTPKLDRPPQTEAEIKIARKRAIIVGIAAYVVFLVWGASLRTGAPDAEMLVTPLVLAGLAAVVARYLRFK